MDFAAPGVGIYTTDIGNKYASVNGTSFSAPIVAASVSMLKAFAGDCSTASIESILDHTATKITDKTIGTGVINIGLALEYARSLEFKTYKPVIAKIVSNSKGTASIKAKISANNVFIPAGFAIYRSTSKDGSYSKIKTVSYNSSSLEGDWDVINWKDSGLSSNKTYYYKIRCYVKNGSGYCYTQYSNVASIKIS